jgi:4-amino-4-deoxy-L-arabinose transferase-like glycosyltransferase
MLLSQPGSQTTLRIIAAALAYFSLNALLLGSVTPTAEWDHAEQLILSQFPALGYNGQPPLYTWLVQGLFAVTGPSLSALLALKAALLTLLVAGVALAARELGLTPAQQWVAALGLALMPQLVWEDQRNFTHTVLAVAVAAWTLVVFLRLRWRADWWGYVALGALFGVGALGKYNYGMFVVALLVAALSLPDWRRRLLSLRFGVSVVVATSLLAPHALWVLGNRAAAGEGFRKLQMQTGVGWETLLDLGAGLAAGLLPLLLLSLLVRRRVGSAGGEVVPGCRLLRRTLLVALLVAVALIIASGARDIKEHWLQPLVFYVTLLVACWADPDGRGLRVFVGIAAAALLGVSIALPGQALWADPARPSRLNAPYADIAARIRQQIPPPALVLADKDPLAGNLRLAFPTAVVMSERSFFPARLPEEGAWLVIGEGLADARSTFRGWLRERLGVGELAVTTTEAPLYHLPDGRLRLQWAVLPAGADVVR